MVERWITVALAALLLIAPLSVSAQEAEVTLSLRDAIGIALERNRTLEQARLTLEAAEDRVDEAWGEVMPRVDLSSSYTRNLDVPVNFLPARIFDPNAGDDDLIGVKFGSDNVWALAITAEQPLFQGAAFIGVGAAGRYQDLQREALRGTAQQTVTEVRLAYYDVLLGQEAVRLREKSLDRIRQSLAETQALQRAGLASEYEVLRLEVEEANMEPTVRQAANQLAAARRALGVLLGLDDPETLRVEASWETAAGELIAQATSPVEATGATEGARLVRFAAPAAPAIQALIEQAKASRTDLRQLELERSLRKAELRVEQVEYLPKVYLFGTYLINAQDNGSPNFFGSGDGQRAYGKQVGVRVSMPLFSGWQRPNRIAQKRTAVEQVDARYRLVLDQAESQVRTLAETVAEAGARAAAQQRAVQQAQRGYDIARVSYREGLGSQLEVTDAELALRQSEFNQAQAIYDYLVATARLDVATGVVPFVDTGDGVALGS